MPTEHKKHRFKYHSTLHHRGKFYTTMRCAFEGCRTHYHVERGWFQLATSDWFRGRTLVP